MEDFHKCISNKSVTENSWIVDIADINTDTWDLTANNPNRNEEVDNRTPQEIIAEIEELDEQATQSLRQIKELL